MKKLGISVEKLLQVAEELQKRREALRVRLLSIKMMLDRGELRMRDRKAEAVGYYQRVLELARRHRLRQQEYELLFQLARCWKGVNEEKFLNCLREMHDI